MKKFKKTIFASVITVLSLMDINNIQASHHFESPLAKKYPQYDLTDMYVFDSDRNGFTAFMLDINPTTDKSGKTAFGDKGIYNFHIAKSRNLDGTGITLTLSIEGNEIVLGIAHGENQAVGAKGDEIGRAIIGKEATLKDGIKIWTGAARDPFVGNSAGIIAFDTELAKGKTDMSTFKDGVDLFANFNSSIIVVELPNKMLPQSMWVYASSAMYNIDKWEQVNRLANPLITHLFMVNNPMEVAEHVGHRPDRDSTREYAISGNVLRAIVSEGKIPNPLAYADSVAKKMLPDMIPYKTGSKANYNFENINGRRPSDDAMDTVLSIFLGRKVTDNANTFDRHPNKFPYVVPVLSN